MDHQSKNRHKIEQRFSQLKNVREQIIIDSMTVLLDNAVEYALEIHDDAHRLHIEIGDDYGWAIVYNGRILDMKVWANKSGRGTAEERMRSLSWSGAASDGYVGIVMAGMEAAPYSIKYEKEILKNAADMTREECFGLFEANCERLRTQ